jgi:hypothetical protein
MLNAFSLLSALGSTLSKEHVCRVPYIKHSTNTLALSICLVSVVAGDQAHRVCTWCPRSREELAGRRAAAAKKLARPTRHSGSVSMLSLRVVPATGGGACWSYIRSWGFRWRDTGVQEEACHPRELYISVAHVHLHLGSLWRR